VPSLSKSKLIAFRQCPRRLWLEVHRPALRIDSEASLARFEVGDAVGELARRLYDPSGGGVLIEPKREGWATAFERTRQLMAAGAVPVFEAAFAAGGALALADVMLPDGAGGWRMIEVKSAGSVKDYHRDDVAVQAFVARRAGVRLSAVSVAVVDTGWTYPGGGDYRGLLVETDLTDEATARDAEVADWVADAGGVAELPQPPAARTGAHCTKPFECGFHAHCASLEPPVVHPVSWLPNVRSRRAHSCGSTATIRRSSSRRR
jgi:hypothetical protein